MAWVDGMSLYLLALIIGAVIGIGQGVWQANNHWTDKIVERSQADPSGIAMPVYEDVEGNVYYVHREVRP
jgi:ABC-type dipeptide/oligopeptide/nickel transport system permease component